MAMQRLLGTEVIHEFLHLLSKRITQPSTLFLLGGSALLLLGNERSTVDIDYLGSDLASTEEPLQVLIRVIADEMQIDIEAVPIDKFIPLPKNAELRHRHLAQIGELDVFVFDPLAIALSKLDRGFESDLEDVAYLVQNKFFTLLELHQAILEAAPFALKYDLSPNAMFDHLETVKILIERRY